jgi:hypothetical protein
LTIETQGVLGIELHQIDFPESGCKRE